MRHALALILLVLPIVAGCAEEAPAAPAEASPEILVVTDANDAEALTNETFSLQSHLHDYWGGAEHIVVMEATQRAQTFLIGPEWTLAFEPSAGEIVPQGASRLDVTLTWSRAVTDTYATPELWVKSPAERDAWKVGPIESGSPVEVPLEAKHADLPHQSLSAWRFELRLHPGPAGLVWIDGEATIRVEAHRGLEIPLFPPHPDPWQDREEIALLDEVAPFGVYMGDPDGGFNCFGYCPQVHRPAAGVVVPHDAFAVEVTLEPGSDSLTALGLRYHGANDRAFVDAPPAIVDGMRQVYLIPLALGMGDGPYASQSQWAFLPDIAGPVEDGVHAASYRITARVLRAGP